MINPVLFISMIIMILIMTAVTVLAAIWSIRKRTSLAKSLRNLSVAFLCYMVFGFLQYYFLEYLYNAEVDKLFGCLSDLCYFMFLICWVRAIMLFSSNEKILSTKLLYIGTAIYGIFVESIIIFAGQYTRLGGFAIQMVSLHAALMVANALYAIVLLIISTRYFFFAQKHLERDKNITQLFCGTLILYMLWTIIADYKMVCIPGAKMSEIVLIDPLMVAYAALGAAVIYFFFKRDPLKLVAKSEEINQEEKLSKTIEEKKLTRREADVLRLVCEGLNNPAIAEALYISQNTVKRHLNNIFHKTGVSNRYELISFILKK